jgi:hypothetical protein
MGTEYNVRFGWYVIAKRDRLDNVEEQKDICTRDSCEAYKVVQHENKFCGKCGNELGSIISVYKREPFPTENEMQLENVNDYNGDPIREINGEEGKFDIFRLWIMGKKLYLDTDSREMFFNPHQISADLTEDANTVFMELLPKLEKHYGRGNVYLKFGAVGQWG